MSSATTTCFNKTSPSCAKNERIRGDVLPVSQRWPAGRPHLESTQRNSLHLKLIARHIPNRILIQRPLSRFSRDGRRRGGHCWFQRLAACAWCGKVVSQPITDDARTKTNGKRFNSWLLYKVRRGIVHERNEIINLQRVGLKSGNGLADQEVNGESWPFTCLGLENRRARYAGTE